MLVFYKGSIACDLLRGVYSLHHIICYLLLSRTLVPLQQSSLEETI